MKNAIAVLMLVVFPRHRPSPGPGPAQPPRAALPFGEGLTADRNSRDTQVPTHLCRFPESSPVTYCNLKNMPGISHTQEICLKPGKIAFFPYSPPEIAALHSHMQIGDASLLSVSMINPTCL